MSVEPNTSGQTSKLNSSTTNSPQPSSGWASSELKDIVIKTALTIIACVAILALAGIGW